MTYFLCWLHFKVLVTRYTDRFLSRPVNSFLFHLSFWKKTKKRVCDERGTVVWRNCSFLPVFHVTVREKQHKHKLPFLGRYGLYPLSFSYFFKRIQLHLSTPLHWETLICEDFSFDGVHWGFFCCQISYAKHIFSGSDHLQYLSTFVHQMSAW